MMYGFLDNDAKHTHCLDAALIAKQEMMSARSSMMVFALQTLNMGEKQSRDGEGEKDGGEKRAGKIILNMFIILSKPQRKRGSRGQEAMKFMRNVFLILRNYY